MLLFLRICAFLLIGIPLLFLLGYLNQWLNLGISAQDSEVFIYPSLTLLYFFLIFPKLRKGLSQHFIKEKKLDRLIAIPVLLAIIKLFIVYLYIFLPTVFGRDAISVGKDQYVSHEELSTLGEILLVGVIGPLNEEIIYRFLFLYFLPYLFLYYTFIKNPLTNKKILSKKWALPVLYIEKLAKWLFYRSYFFQDKILIGFWILVISSLFSLGHGPTLYSFPIYFLPGVLYSYLFLRYGLVASWIAHGVGNALSPIMYHIFISIMALINL